MDKYVRCRSLLTDAPSIIHHCILVHAHIHTHSVVHSCYSELVSFQHVCPLLPACGLPVFISERSRTSNASDVMFIIARAQHSSARPTSRDTPFTLRYTTYLELDFLPVCRETSLLNVQEVRSLKVWDMACSTFDNQSPSAVTSSKTSFTCSHISTKSWPSHTHPF